MGKTVKDSQQTWETVIDMQQLHGSGRESQQLWEKVRDMQQLYESEREGERHVATPWEKKDSERQPANIVGNERLAECLCHWEGP